MTSKTPTSLSNGVITQQQKTTPTITKTLASASVPPLPVPDPHPVAPAPATPAPPEHDDIPDPVSQDPVPDYVAEPEDVAKATDVTGIVALEQDEEEEHGENNDVEMQVEIDVDADADVQLSSQAQEQVRLEQQQQQQNIHSHDHDNANDTATGATLHVDPSTIMQIDSDHHSMSSSQLAPTTVPPVNDNVIKPTTTITPVPAPVPTPITTPITTASLAPTTIPLIPSTTLPNTNTNPNTNTKPTQTGITKPERRRRIRLTVKQKVEVLRRLDSGERQSTIASEYGCSKRALARLKQERSTFTNLQLTEADSHRKSRHSVKHVILENKLSTFLRLAKQNRFPISGNIVRRAALKLRDDLLKDPNLSIFERPGLLAFQASINWSKGFLKRCAIRTIDAKLEPQPQKQNGANNNVHTNAQTEQQQQQQQQQQLLLSKNSKTTVDGGGGYGSEEYKRTLDKVLLEYDLDCIFTVEKTHMFYKLLPNEPVYRTFSSSNPTLDENNSLHRYDLPASSNNNDTNTTTNNNNGKGTAPLKKESRLTNSKQTATTQTPEAMSNKKNSSTTHKSNNSSENQQHQRAAERVTLIFSTNVTGSIKVAPTIVGNETAPQSFSAKPCKLPYLSQSFCWIDDATFKTWFYGVLIPTIRRMTSKRVAILVSAEWASLDVSDSQGQVKLISVPKEFSDDANPMNNGILSVFRRSLRYSLLSQIITYKKNHTTLPQQQLTQGTTTSTEPIQTLKDLEKHQHSFVADAALVTTTNQSTNVTKMNTSNIVVTPEIAKAIKLGKYVPGLILDYTNPTCVVVPQSNSTNTTTPPASSPIENIPANPTATTTIGANAGNIGIGEVSVRDITVHDFADLVDKSWAGLTPALISKCWHRASILPAAHIERLSEICGSVSWTSHEQMLFSCCTTTQIEAIRTLEDLIINRRLIASTTTSTPMQPISNENNINNAPSLSSIQKQQGNQDKEKPVFSCDTRRAQELVNNLHESGRRGIETWLEIEDCQRTLRALSFELDYIISVYRSPIIVPKQSGKRSNNKTKSSNKKLSSSINNNTNTPTLTTTINSTNTTTNTTLNHANLKENVKMMTTPAPTTHTNGNSLHQSTQDEEGEKIEPLPHLTYIMDLLAPVQKIVDECESGAATIHLRNLKHELVRVKSEQNSRASDTLL